MAQLCRAQGLPEPEFVSTPYDFTVTFRKDPYTPERLRQLGLSARQARAVQWVRERGSISNAEYRLLIGGITDRTALRDLEGLLKAGIFTRPQSGRQAHYTLKSMEPDKPDMNPT